MCGSSNTQATEDFVDMPNLPYAAGSLLDVVAAYLRPKADTPTPQSNMIAKLGADLVKLVAGEAEVERRALALIAEGRNDNAAFVNVLEDFANDFKYADQYAR